MDSDWSNWQIQPPKLLLFSFLQTCTFTLYDRETFDQRIFCRDYFLNIFLYFSFLTTDSLPLSFSLIFNWPFQRITLILAPYEKKTSLSFFLLSEYWTEQNLCLLDITLTGSLGLMGQSHKSSGWSFWPRDLNTGLDWSQRWDWESREQP